MKQQYPIKYIENNLVLNHDGEWFAYYELIPYNYSFLSPEQKMQIHDSLLQLVAQNREGKIHALQIATESSLRAIQEASKKEIKGKLKETAMRIVDEQTEALVEMIGENQIDYRFFIGFKLIPAAEEFSIKALKKTVFRTLSEFVHEVNHTLMGDFVVVSNDEIERFEKLEKLQNDKLNRRFKVRQLEKKDFGYLLEHLHGQSGISYEDYQFHMPVVKTDTESIVKQYDLIKPTRCLIEEHPKYLKVEREERTVYMAYLSISDIVGELDFPSSEIFYYQQQQFEFPIDTSINIEIVPNKKALTKVRNKKKELKDLDNHAWESNTESTNQVEEALEASDELEAVLDKTKEPMHKLSYVVRVWADDLEELKRRVNAVKDFYDDVHIKMERPFGDMRGLHSEFIPASHRYMNDYIQYVKSDFLAGLGFGASQVLGENYGIYVGYNVDTNKNVYIRPSLAAQGVKGSVTNALSMAFIGSLGGGKSFANNLICYYAALFGAKVLIIDPKSERGGWKERLPDIAEEINIVNLTSEKKNKGLLDPYVIMKDEKDAESLAINILTFLTGISGRDNGREFAILRSAIRTVTEQEKRGLLLVIEELKRMNTELSLEIAERIEPYTDYDFAQLLFSDGTVEDSISLDKQINILQVADLVLPDAETTLKEYTALELLSVSMLIIISTFALDFIKSDRTQFKIVDEDEAWAFLQVASGKALSNKLVRAGRSMNAGVYFVTQNTDDLQDEKMKNNIGLKFAFRSTDIQEIKKTLEFFGIDKEDEENQKRLSNLENGQCLMQDLYGRIGVVQIHPVFEEIFTAFDTRPPVEWEEVM